MPKNTEKELFKIIGNKIKLRRMELKYSQEKLGELLDISYTAIQRYENASAKIPIDNLLKICRILSYLNNPILFLYGLYSSFNGSFLLSAGRTLLNFRNFFFK